MNKVVKYLLATAATVAMGYNSVYISKLSEVQAKGSSGRFDAKTYASQFWQTRLPPALAQATDLGSLLDQLTANRAAAFQAHAHSLSIGDSKYFLVKGTGDVTAVDDDGVTLRLAAGRPAVRIATEYVYGNAARDALQAASLNQVGNTTDLNTVAAELNKRIRAEVLPPFRAAAQPGKRVNFVGAIALNKKHLHVENLTVIPVRLQVE